MTVKFSRFLVLHSPFCLPDPVDNLSSYIINPFKINHICAE